MAKTFGERVKEGIYNIPNALTLSRIILTPIIVLLILYSERKVAVIWFIIAALTDAFDGQIARRFNQKTEFGRVLDPIADRIFMVAVVMTIVIKYDLRFMALILVREVLAIIGAARRVATKKRFIVAGFSAKLTTVLQSVTVPAVLLEVPYYQAFIIATVVVGVVSGAEYMIRD